MNGGVVAGELRALKGSVVNVHGGEIGERLFNRVDEAEFNVFGGSARRFTVDDAQLNLFGGSYVDAVISASDVDIRGGSYSDLRIDTSNIAIRGGALEGVFWASNSDITLYGSNFLLNGEPVEGLLNQGDSVELVTTNNDILNGIIAGGDEIRFNIVERRPPGPGTVAISVDSRITLVYTVPEPTSLLLSMTAVVLSFPYSPCTRKNS